MGRVNGAWAAVVAVGAETISLVDVAVVIFVAGASVVANPVANICEVSGASVQADGGQLPPTRLG